MFLFAEQCPDVVIEKALKRPFLHTVLLGYLYSLGSCKGWSKQIYYRLLLAVERILIKYVLNTQCGFLEILCQFDGSFYRQQVDIVFITLTAKSIGLIG